MSRSLPDAPSVQAAKPTQKFEEFVEVGSPMKVDAMGGDVELMQHAEFAGREQALSNRQQTKTIFEKYLYPSSIKQPSHNSGFSNVSVMRRATSAATRTLVTRNVTGRARLNTSYLLRILTSVAKDTASTPYWRRTRAEPLSDFGSTVGSDAGMNLWHEFGPSVEQALKSHTPRFVSRIAARIGVN
ncbi:MAG: hypothetical protein ABSA78_14260 [Candidatus Sulfotelmatobacter sp.]